MGPAYVRAVRSAFRGAGGAELALPAAEQVVLDADDVEHLAGDEVDELLDLLRSVVERRARRQHDGSGLVELEQSAQGGTRERGLARDDDERPTLLQVHLGG